VTSSPPFVVNVTGGETLSVRDVAQRFGARLGRTPRFTGEERPDALLSNTDRMRGHFAAPEVTVETMMDWVASWIARGAPMLDKPTHFEERSGTF
jgi:hypothetical protein